MTLEEQWQEDVKQFGELAYLMWQCRELHENEWVDCVSNYESLAHIESLLAKRKQSAALPFDLAAARAGDKVEYLVCGEWLQLYAKDLTDFGSMVQFERCDGKDGEISKERLRMKHPRRVGVDYSQFED